MNALKKALEIVGGPTAMAKRLGEKPQTVSAWSTRSKGRVPAEHCPSIELETDGRVTCEELRPDVKWWVVRVGVHGAPPAPDSVHPAANDADHQRAA
jgi:DNA-binding transcriptional regulator YdaS (Cro superfamily)